MKKSMEERYHEADTRFYQTLMEHASAVAELHGLDARGWDAFYVLFAERFGWTPAQTRSLSLEELSLMLDEFFPPKPRRTKSGS